MAVHPRGHGEHAWLYFNDAIVHGSSPWARGTRNCAVSATNNKPVHPRGHGEHINPRIVRSAGIGSSPWARGTLIINGKRVRF